MTKFNTSCQNPYARPASYSESPTLEEILTEEELQEFKANQELEEQIREESRLSALEVLPWDDIQYIPPQEEHIEMSQSEEELLQETDFCDMPDDSELDGLGHFVETPDGGYWEYPHLRHF